MNEAYFYDTCTKVGDEEDTNKFVLLDMTNEIKNSEYHSFARHIRGSSKNAIKSKNFVTT